jgi:hypothetical protein
LRAPDLGLKSTSRNRNLPLKALARVSVSYLTFGQS